MSYILDALNKSENERRAAAAPGLLPGTSFVVAPRKNSHRGSAAFAIGVGMLVTGLALGSWRPWQSPPGEAAPRVVALSTAEVPVVPPAAPVAPKPPAKAAPAPTAVVKTVRPAGAVEAAAPAGEKSRPKMIARTPPPATPEGVAEPQRIAAVPVARVVAAAPVPAKEAPAPRQKRVVSYGELPASIRQSLPEISFGGFAGTDDDAVNIAFINNRLVKAGEEVSPGLKLESVAQDGVVMAYQGHRFKP